MPLDLFERVIFLRTTALAEGLSPPALRAMAEVVREVTLDPGELIARENEPGAEIYLVVAGTVGVRRLGATPPNDARAEALGAPIGSFGPGSVLGEMAVLSDEARSASMIAEDRVTLFALHREDLRDAIASCPDLAFGLFRVLIERVRRADARAARASPTATSDGEAA